MQLRTVEVRWFRAGRCPESVSAWFHAGPFVGEPEHRIDTYLRLPDRGDLGVKQRGEAVLDLKIRAGTPDPVVLPAGLEGRVEAWIKWSFMLDPGATDRGGSWIEVHKTRWSRLYEAGRDGAAAAVPSGLVLPNACGAELVEVRSGPHRSWGFGFEAYGADLDAGVVLAAAARACVADTPLGNLRFGTGDSYSYPAWLRLWPEPE